MDELESTVCRVTLDIARRNAPALREVGMGQGLVDQLGLGSMDLAELIATLEAELGVDPFATVAISKVKTVGDLCAAFRAASV